MRPTIKKRIFHTAAAVFGAVLIGAVSSADAYAGMNLETGAALSGIAVALNNYYARTTSPEHGLAETVMMASHGTIVIDDEKTSTVRQKLVEDSTPVQEKIVTEDGITYGTVKGTATLRLREAPDSEARTLTLLAEGEHYVVIGQDGDFLQVQIDDDLTGYVFKDYIDTSIKYDDEITDEELKKKAEETERLKAEAEEAMRKLEEAKAHAAESKAVEKESSKAETKAKETTKAETKPKETTKAETKPKETTKAETKPKETTKAEETEKKPESSSGSNVMIGNKPTAGSGESTASASRSDGTVIVSGPPVSTEKSGEGMIESKPTAAAETKPETTEAEKKTTEAEKKTTEAATKAENSQGPGGPGSVNSATRNAMVAYAKQYLGGTYVYGGTDMDSGVDCSGFTMRIYEHFGYDIGRTSRDQAVSGTSISADNAKPGDLIFYDKDGTINHVGMYIGNGQVIHASSSTTGIIISNAYYRTPCKVVSYLE